MSNTGIKLPPFHATLRAHARQREAVLAPLVYDSLAFLADPWMVLALAAERTTSIRIGVCVLTPRLRHFVANGLQVVLGDAAHASAPHLTQGAAMALEDAVVLAELFDCEGGLDQRLAAFMQRRLPRAKLVQGVSHGIVSSDMATTMETLSDYLAHESRISRPAGQGRGVSQPGCLRNWSPSDQRRCSASNVAIGNQ